MSRDINNKYWDEELETLPREELEKRQLADLQEIVKFAYDNAPYYKRSFDAKVNSVSFCFSTACSVRGRRRRQLSHSRPRAVFLPTPKPH